MTRLTHRGLMLDDFPDCEPSILADFSNSKTLNPLMTFSRNSTATVVNENGIVELVDKDQPRFNHDPATGECKGLIIENQRANISNTSNYTSGWQTARLNLILNCATAPDGSFTATKMVEDTQGGNTHTLSKLQISYTAGTTYTMSVFAKPAERTVIMINYPDSAINNISSGHAVYNLATGEHVVNGPGQTRMEEFPNGWWRCSLTIQATASVTTTNFQFALCHQFTSNYNDAAVYEGDGKSGLYVWGAQFEIGSNPSSYMPSIETFTSRATVATKINENGKIVLAMPGEERISYNPENLNYPPKLLIEKTSTNLLQHSNDISNSYWGKVRVNLEVSPGNNILEGVTLHKIVPTAIDNNHTISRTVTISQNTEYTFSFYARAAGYNFARLRIGLDSVFHGSFVLNLLTGDVVFQDATMRQITATRTIDGWWRMSASFNSGTATNVDVSCWVYDNTPTANFVGDGISGIEVTGLQLEEGYLTSYIPTATTTLTRLEDTVISTAVTRAEDQLAIQDENFASFFNKEEGTFLMERAVNNRPSTGSIAILRLSDRGTDNAIMELEGTSGSAMAITLNGAGQMGTSVISYDAEEIITVALAYKRNSSAYSLLGAIYTDNSVILPEVNRAMFGSFASGLTSTCMHLSRFYYYPVRLSDTNLKALTAR